MATTVKIPIRTKKDFLAALAKTPYKWYFDLEGMLRAGRGKYVYCPVAAVARQLTGVYYNHFLAAADAIGLPVEKAADIVDAADSPHSWRACSLRKRLLRAVGVREQEV